MYCSWKELKYIYIYYYNNIYYSFFQYMKILWYEINKLENIKTKWFKTPFSQFSTSWIKINNSVFYDIYKKNPDVRQAINKIALSVSKNGLIVTNKNGEQIKTDSIDKEVESYFLDQTFLKFKKELFKQYLLSWELYIINNKNLKNETVGFQILDSRTMSKLVDATWNIVWFTQYTNNPKTKKYTRDEVAFYKLENNTDNENNWMWLLEWVVRDALADIKWAEKNYYIIENDSMPWWMILLNDNMSMEEQQNAVEQFSRQHRGADNSNKMVVAGGIKDIKNLYISNKDMDRINQRKLTTEKVSSALWVPKNILWYTDSVNYANWKEMRLEYIEGTIRPYEQDFKFILNTLLAKFAPAVFKKYNIEIDGETMEDREQIEKNQRDDIKFWIQTIDEVRLERWLKPFDIEQSKNPVVANNIIMLEDIIMNNWVNLWEPL